MSDQDLAAVVRIYVDDCLRRHYREQLDETAIAKWLAYEDHEARGPENDLDALAKSEEVRRELIAEWRQLAPKLRSLAIRIEAHHGVKASPLPPPGSRKREPLTETQKVQRALAQGEVVSMQEITFAKEWDQIQEAAGRFYGPALRELSPVEASIKADHYVGALTGYAIVSGFGYVIKPRGGWYVEHWTEPAILAYIAELTPKAAQLRASYLHNGADWLERAATIVEDAMQDRAVFTRKRAR